MKKILFRNTTRRTREPTGKDTVKSAFRSDRQCQHKKFGASSFDTLFSVSETCRLSDLKADFTVSLPVRSLDSSDRSDLVKKESIHQNCVTKFWTTMAAWNGHMTLTVYWKS